MLGKARERARSFVERHHFTSNDAAIMGGAALTSVMSIGLGLILVNSAVTTTVAQQPSPTKVIRPHVTVVLPTAKATPVPQLSPAPGVAAQQPSRVLVVSHDDADTGAQPGRTPAPSRQSHPTSKPSPTHSPSPRPKPTQTCNSVPLTTVKVCHG